MILLLNSQSKEVLQLPENLGQRTQPRREGVCSGPKQNSHNQKSASGTTPF